MSKKKGKKAKKGHETDKAVAEALSCTCHQKFVRAFARWLWEDEKAAELRAEMTGYSS